MKTRDPFQLHAWIHTKPAVWTVTAIKSALKIADKFLWRLCDRHISAWYCGMNGGHVVAAGREPVSILVCHSVAPERSMSRAWQQNSNSIGHDGSGTSKI